ncbi:MAG: hemolysin family protein, partial [Chloroflexi bacterium]|nr:hemolysin family protein [Chloroflexota bacterium]
MEGNTTNLIIALVCMVLSGFFSSSEAAFLSLQRTRVQHLLSIGKPGAKLVSDMQSRPERLLSTILLGNNLVNILFASMATIITLSYIESEESIWFIVSTIIMTAVVLVFGEVVPKALAVQYSERIAFWYARPLKILEITLYPAVLLLEWLGKKVRFGSNQEEKALSITEGEFRTLIDVGEAEGALEPREAELLESVFRFGDRKVSEVMTPRPEIVMLESEITLGGFLTIHAEHEHSRFPVYKGEPDNIIGTVSVKDILKTMAKEGIVPEQSLIEALRPTIFVPEGKLVGGLFEEMRRKGVQLSIVINEY